LIRFMKSRVLEEDCTISCLIGISSRGKIMSGWERLPILEPHHSIKKPVGLKPAFMGRVKSGLK
jgi:hypothetical protein